MASPLPNQIHKIDLDTGTVGVVFDAQTEQEAIAFAEGLHIVEAGDGTADLLGSETTGEMHVFYWDDPWRRKRSLSCRQSRRSLNQNIANKGLVVSKKFQ